METHLGEEGVLSEGEDAVPCSLAHPGEPCVPDESDNSSQALVQVWISVHTLRYPYVWLLVLGTAPLCIPM